MSSPRASTCAKNARSTKNAAGMAVLSARITEESKISVNKGGGAEGN